MHALFSLLYTVAYWIKGERRSCTKVLGVLLFWFLCFNDDVYLDRGCGIETVEWGSL
jgi:hypothetical protein